MTTTDNPFNAKATATIELTKREMSLFYEYLYMMEDFGKVNTERSEYIKEIAEIMHKVRLQLSEFDLIKQHGLHI